MTRPFCMTLTTSRLCSGWATTAIGVLLGNGMYNVRATLHQVRDRLVRSRSSGSCASNTVMDRLMSSAPTGVRVHPGPITFSCVYGGEDYDARLEPIGWNQPGFDDANGEKPEVVQGPGGILRGLSAAAPPVRAIET